MRMVLSPNVTTWPSLTYYLKCLGPCTRETSHCSCCCYRCGWGWVYYSLFLFLHGFYPSLFFFFFLADLGQCCHLLHSIPASPTLLWCLSSQIIALFFVVSGVSDSGRPHSRLRLPLSPGLSHPPFSIEFPFPCDYWHTGPFLPSNDCWLDFAYDFLQLATLPVHPVFAA